MKPFVFLDQEYTDLNTLGMAFAEHFKSAISAIQEKEFLSFIKKFKKEKQECLRYLFESRYLQSALSMLIYHMTNDHLLVLGGKAYQGIEAVLKSIKEDVNISIFLSDKGISNTLLPILEDEKLKQDIIALEQNHADEFAIDYMQHYFEGDSITNIAPMLNELFVSSDERFGTATRLFSDEKVQVVLAHRFSLKEVLQMRREPTVVFSALKLIKSEFDLSLLMPVLEDTFYLDFLKHLKEYKWKKNAQYLLKELKVKEKFLRKKKDKISFEVLLHAHQELYSTYLRVVSEYKKGNIIAKSEAYALVLPYAHTFIYQSYVEGHVLTLSNASEEAQSALKTEYQLEKLSHAIDQHQHFSWVLLFIEMLALIALAVCVVLSTTIAALKETTFGKAQLTLINIQGGLLPILISGSISFGLIVFIFIKNGISRSKFYKLCKLEYYRNNEFILLNKQKEEYAILQEKEDQYAKTIDRFYRFYGAFAGGALAILLSVLIAGLIYSVGLVPLAEDQSNMIHLLKNVIFYLPSLGVVVIGCLRHKKTVFSALLVVLLGIGIGFGMTLLLGKM